MGGATEEKDFKLTGRKYELTATALVDRDGDQFRLRFNLGSQKSFNQFLGEFSELVE
jgi:hypothetical protein